MSMLSSRAITTLPIPFDPPHEVTIQKLSGRHFYKADTENDFQAQEYVRKMGGAEFRRQLDEATKGKPDAVETTKRDPVHGYDKHTVVFYGLRAWTYQDDPIPDPKDADARHAFVDDIDAVSLEWLAREILRFTKPALFTDKEEAKAAQKETHADPSFA